MSRLARNISYNLVGQSLLLAVGLLAMRSILKATGQDSFGLILFGLTLNSLLVSLLDLGIGATTVREVAAHVDSDIGYVRRLIRTAGSLYWSAYALLGVALWFVAPLLATRWLHLTSLHAATAAEALRWLSLGAALALPRSLYASILRGLQRMLFVNLIELGMNLFQQITAIAVLLLGGGVIQVAAGFSVGFALAVVVYALVISRFLAPAVLVPAMSGDVLAGNARFSTQVMGISSLAMVQTQADKVLLSKLASVASFGYYSLLSTVFARVMLLAVAVAQAGFPALAAAAGERDREPFVARYRKLHDLLCFASAVPLAAVAFAVVPVLGLVIGPAAAARLIIPGALLALGYYMNATLNMPYMASLAAGRPDITVRLNLLALVVVLPILAGSILTLGLTGAAVGWVVYHLLSYGYAIPRICKACLGMSTAAWWRHLARPFGLVVVTYGVAWALTAAFGAATWYLWVVAYVLATVAFVGASFGLMSRPLRASMVSAAEGIAQVLRPRPT